MPEDERLEQPLTGRGLEHQQREHHLQDQPPRHGPPVDRAAVRRKRVRDAEDHDQSNERLQPRHAGKLRCERDDGGDPRRCAEDHQVAHLIRRARRRRRVRSHFGRGRRISHL